MHTSSTTPLPSVSVIIATYNRANVLRECLKRYATQTHPNVEILVAVNGSVDNTAEMLAQEFPHVKVLEYKQGIGPKALNDLVAISSGELLWRTDDDAYPENDETLEVAARFIADRPNVVALSGEIIERTIGYNVVNYFPDKYTPGDEVPDGLPLNEFCGAAAMIRREPFLEAGGFWDQFFMEELDVSIRIRLLPRDPMWQIKYTPWIKIVHENAFSGQGNQASRWKLQLSQNIRIQWRYYPLVIALGRSVVIAMFMFVSALSHRISIVDIVKGAWWSLQTAWHARFHERVRVRYSQLRKAAGTRNTFKSQFVYYLKRIRQRRQYV